MDRATDEELRGIVSTAVDEGINLFDVTYDEEKRVLGRLLRELGVGGTVFLSCWMDGKLTRKPMEVKGEAERSLGLLGVQEVGLLYLDGTCTPARATAMAEVREAGVARFIGALGTQTELLTADLALFDVVLTGHNYYLRERESAIEQVREANPHLGLITVEPIGRGRFAMDSAPPGVSMVSACLKYTLGFPAADSALVAVRTLSQLRANIEVWQSGESLTDGEHQALEAGQGYVIPRPE